MNKLNIANTFRDVIVAVIASAFCFGIVARPAAAGTAEAQVYTAAAPAVVFIARKTTNGSISIGSGSVLTSGGLVLTNLHVVGDNPTVAVYFKPRVEGAPLTQADMRLGTVVRRDQVTDLALVQVADVPVDVKPLPLGSAADIAVGSDVHAIGHPLGEQWTYTKGIVSQIRREVDFDEGDHVKHHANVIQTQTPINPGNSGGPLLSNGGTLIGVNTFSARSSEGLNFAVSVEEVKVILNAKADRLAVPAPQLVVSDTAPQGIRCEPRSLGVSRLSDGSGSIELFDLDCSGKPNARLILPDAPTLPYRLEIDNQHSGIAAGVLYSQGRNGKWDYSIWDNGNGKSDVRCFHSNGFVNPTRCERSEG